jgi:RND family efflux transporter MFP subunit
MVGVVVGQRRNAVMPWKHARALVDPVRALALASLVALAACGEENKYVAPPPPKVVVMAPVQQPVTRYLEATGNTAAVNTANLVARVQGFVQDIKYQDGDFVKKGTPLFVIEPEPYKLKLDQAKAAEEGAQATLKQNEAEFQRQAELQTKQVSTQANYDKALAARDNARASLEEAQSNTQQAAINYGYTTVEAPFDGVVTARQVSIGELVGNAATPTVLATIVQLDPIWVNFNISEQDVLRVRAAIERRGLTQEDLKKIPVEVGLQTESGYPHKGTLDYAAPTVSQSTGTLAVRGILQNEKRELLPGYFVRVRVPGPQQNQLLVPDTALGSDQSGRYVLVVNRDNVVEQRKVEIGPLVGELRVITDGLKPDDRVVVSGILRAIPGQKVDPQTQSADARSGAAK